MLRKKKFLLAVYFLLTLVGSAFLVVAIQHQKYPDTKNLNQAYRQVLSAREGEATVLVFHKPGCARCEGAKADVWKVVHELKKSNPKVTIIVINVNRSDAQQFMNHFSVGRYPYFIVLNGQKEKASFSAIKFNIMKKNLKIALQEKVS